MLLSEFSHIFHIAAVQSGYSSGQENTAFSVLTASGRRWDISTAEIIFFTEKPLRSFGKILVFRADSKGIALCRILGELKLRGIEALTNSAYRPGKVYSDLIRFKGEPCAEEFHYALLDSPEL